ncbi:hypothetical protein ACG2LH_15885 [Zhouia sp. PK063]|uniref:hypothetical protein n=1 Tax=Zhouia sp. PK063 TaxID=3373602 RepID=UPI0037A32294
MKFTLNVILLIFLMVSCSKNKKNHAVALQYIHTDKGKTLISKKTIFPDFINLSEADFEKFEKGKNSKWFKYHNQKLYFLPYTDYSITTLILTAENLKDKHFINLFKADEIIIEDSIHAIPSNEFITDKGIKLNNSKSMVEKIYGKPDSIKVTSKNETMYWNFIMNENRKNYNNGNLKPFVYNGIEFSAKMTFENDSLKTLIYEYEVP